MRVFRTFPSLAVVLAGLAWPTATAAQSAARFDEHLLSAFTFRNVGPFRMQARGSMIAVPPTSADEPLTTFYLAFWTGGVFKTTNAGATFTPIFDGDHKLTVGAIAVAPSNAKVVWVGTGDTRGARSSFPGDGVYKSTDAGGTWTNMGLPDSHHISRVVIHPTNPDIVYVGVMGHLYSPNEERGVFKTTDGGRSWSRVFFVNDQIGVNDLVMNPRDPNTLYAATYDKRRTPWSHINAGPESAIYKTTDGGTSWTRLAGGLPTGRIGKIGLDIHLRNPDVVYAVINNDNPGPTPGNAGGCTGGRRAGLIGGELYGTTDGGRTWTKRNSDDEDLQTKGSGYIGSGDEDCDGFTQVRVDPDDPAGVWNISVWISHSTDGGRSWTRDGVFPGIFGDVRTLWIDPNNPERMIVGDDGGFSISYDGGRSSDHFHQIPVGEPYSVSYDMEQPYNIYASLQDHESWKGPSIGSMGYTSVLDWYALSSGDGMYTRVDPEDGRWAYTTSEWGGVFRTDQELGIRESIRPARPGGGPRYRSIWGTPIEMSPHDGSTLYTGGEVLLKTTDRGESWSEISPDLSTAPPDKLAAPTEAGQQQPNYWFAISAISESPVTPDLLWVGTSDGRVHVSRNGGGSWTDRTAAVAAAGGPEQTYVSTVFASNHLEGRAYVSKSGNKEDDFRPYLFVTDDFGASWRSIAGDLPDEPVHVVWEDDRNPDVLLVGNGDGVYVTNDRGQRWVRLTEGIPHVPVLSLAVHPRDRDLIVGAFGRNVWVGNVAPLSEMSETVLAEDVHLFPVEPTVQRIPWAFGANDRLFGQRWLQTPNPSLGMTIQYYLREPGSGPASVVISDASGAEVARLEGTTDRGINTVVWSTRAGGGRGGRGGGGRGGYSPDQWAPLGDYVVALDVGGRTLTRPATIVRRQSWALGPEPVRIVN